MKTISRSEADANTTGRRFQITFNGDALEYFKIWFVNNLCIILTLGLYYPWAKVRSKRYLIANFSLGGSTGNFDYQAPGKSVFIGLGIVLIFVGIGYLVKIISVTAVILYLGISLILLPWFIVRSMAFSARYTCFRGLRFSFVREYLPVYFAIFIWLCPINVAVMALMLRYSELGMYNNGVLDLSALENPSIQSALIGWSRLLLLALLWMVVILPRTLWAIHKYKVEHYFLGTIGFSFEAKLGAYYGIFFKGILPLLILLLLLFSIPVFQSFGHSGRNVEYGAYLGIILFLLAVIAPLSCLFLYRALLLKCFWGGVWLKGEQSRIRMEYPISKYMFVQFIMFCAILFSLGLLRPWAKIYQCKYLARHTFLEAAPRLLDNLMEGDQQAVSAIGAEYIDLADPGIGLDFGWG